MSRPPRPPCACTQAVPASLCPVLCVCLYCGRQKHAMAVSRAILLLCQRDGSALLLRLYALSKPSRPASRGGSPLRQDLAAPVRPKGSPPALSFHNDYLILADFPPIASNSRAPKLDVIRMTRSPGEGGVVFLFGEEGNSFPSSSDRHNPLTFFLLHFFFTSRVEFFPVSSSCCRMHTTRSSTTLEMANSEYARTSNKRQLT